MKRYPALRRQCYVPPQGDLAALDDAIERLAVVSAGCEIRSLESAATALANLLRLRREINPPTADDLAEIAFQAGITPDDFLAVVRRRSEASTDHFGDSV